MRTYTKRYIRRAIWMLGALPLALTAQAASFDCAKAGTKVEHIICDNPEISKLDDELAQSYKSSLQDTTKADQIRQSQMRWLKERNSCVDAQCVKRAYQGRIIKLSIKQNARVGGAQAAQKKQASSNLIKRESYMLVMSRDAELCNHMLHEFNDDLKKYGWNGDKRQEEHEEFKRVHWKPARFSYDYNGHLLTAPIEGALFDFNNDGIQDFVVRKIGSLSNRRADSLYLLDAGMANKSKDLTSADLLGAKNQISLAGYGYYYQKKYHMLDMDVYPFAFDPRVLEPFIFHNESYLVMSNLFENEKARTGGYAVIVKYDGGKFVGNDVTGTAENICLFRR